jgi:hypothetical protein
MLNFNALADILVAENYRHSIWTLAMPLDHVTLATQTIWNNWIQRKLVLLQKARNTLIAYTSDNGHGFEQTLFTYSCCWQHAR